MPPFDFASFGFGRIDEIIDALLKQYNVKSIASVPLEDKIKALCFTVGLSVKEFDDMVANNSPVLRSVKGHCFEVVFERLLANNGYYSEAVGGDSDTDLVVNGLSLQLKTPNMGGTDETKIQYKTHKTHGAKSLDESKEYLHTVDDFADYLVGLINYNPLEVYIIPKNLLPRWAEDSHYIESPFTLPLPNPQMQSNEYFEFINNFCQLGLSIKDFSVDIYPTDNELLPNTSHELGLKSEIIIDSIMRKCNFRIWDMSIRGFTRETAMERWLNKKGVPFSTHPEKYRDNRADKADVVLLTKPLTTFVQVKGLTLGGCKFNGEKTILDVESQLSRGRVNDDETKSRLYKTTDFDYLGVVVDPLVNYNICGRMEWDYFLIPTSLLKTHPNYPRRIFSHQYLVYKDIQQFRLTSARITQVFEEALHNS